jgi:hypothetical protein
MSDAIRTAGAKLANIAYNLAQRKDLPPDIIACLDACRREWDAAVRAPSAPVAREVPEGWQLVPKEPTAAMMDGAFNNISLSDAHSTYGVTEHVWDFMLAAAPTPPLPGETPP